MRKLTMKSVLIAIMATLMCNPTSATAQNTNKELKKDLNSRVDKDSRKTAKKLEKDDWQIMPGKLPLERQIQDSRYAELDTNEEGGRAFFTATHQSLGGNYSAAKKIATSRAIAELAEQVGSEIASIVENNVSNINFGDGDLETIDKCISANKQTVAAKLSGAVQVLDIFRQGEKSCEVMVMYKLDSKNALTLARNLYKEALQKESSELSEKINTLVF